jgi:hypothetical protein
MTQTIAAIPTTYASHAFRSRLEAKWAALFDLLRWEWTYEPFDAGGWIPDFLIQGEAPFLVEVGPCVTEADYKAKAAKALTYPALPTLIVGAAVTMPGDWPDYAGMLVNEFPTNPGPWHAFWQGCGQCKRVVIYGDDVTRPCRHPFVAFDHDSLRELWGEAGAITQWQP